MATAESITRVEPFTTAADFFEEISPRSHRKNARVELPQILHRGQRSAQWALLPTALRVGAFKSYYEDDSELREPLTQKHQLKAELEAFVTFLTSVDLLGLPIPDDSMALREVLEDYPERLLYGADHSDSVIWPPRAMQAALALAQHSGIPTRLLDWTSDPYSAAYFAASDAAHWLLNSPEPNRADHLAVWSCDRTLFSRYKHLGRNIGSKFLHGTSVPVEFFSVPRASNLNAKAQAGWFSVEREEINFGSPVARTSLDAIVAASVLGEEEIVPVFTKYTLPIVEAPDLLWKLSQYGYTSASQFPDYYGAAKSVKARRLYNLPES